jgi:hypothetical protein
VVATGIQVAVASLREPLEHLGFRKRAGEVFTVDLADQVLGWLGLNHASRHMRPGEAEVNPVIGVRHQAVERLVAELRGQKFHEYRPPTVSTPIGYVMPERRYAAWVFGPDRGAVSAAELMAAVTDYGLPFMRSLVGLPALRESIEQGLSHYGDYRLPVVLAMMGHLGDATAAMARAVDQLGDRRDPAAQQLRHFAEQFRRREWSAA